MSVKIQEDFTSRRSLNVPAQLRCVWDVERLETIQERLTVGKMQQLVFSS